MGNKKIRQMLSAIASILFLFASSAWAGEHGGGILDFDPTLFIATWITFGIFFGITLKFGWRPLMNALEEREKRLKENLQSTEKAKGEAESERQEASKRLEVVEKEAKKLREDLQKQTQEEREKLIEKNRNEASKILEEGNKQVEVGRLKAMQELSQEVSSISIQIASQILGSEIDEKKHHALIQNSIKKLEKTGKTS